MGDVIILTVDGFCLRLLESPPSRVPASRKPLDSHGPDGPVVRICNIHFVSSHDNRWCGDLFVHR